MRVKKKINHYLYIYREKKSVTPSQMKFFLKVNIVKS